MPWPRLFRDPLTHFLLLGGSAFLLHQVLGPRERIVVSAPEVAALVAAQENRAGLAPSAPERDALIDAHVRNRVLEAQGRALGLDRNDPVIARHVAQKMELLLESQAPAPTQAQLRAHFDQHRARYSVPARLTFEHYFAGGAGPAHRMEADAIAQAARRGERLGELGRPFPHGSVFTNASEPRIAGVFGGEFARSVITVPLDAWTVVRSGHGWHAVRVEARELSRPASFDEARKQLETEVSAQLRRAAVAAGVEDAKRRFEVEVEP